MKIGILTFHRADNCGAVLQCYALQKFLQNMGHDVEVIDYRNSYIEDVYSTSFKLKSFVKKFLKTGPFGYFRYIRNKKKAKSKFDLFRNKFLNTSRTCGQDNVSQDYDAYVIGSDQMWTVRLSGSFDNVYFGQFQRSKHSKLIGYAISSNCDFVEYLQLLEIQKIVHSFDYLSFREDKVSDLVKCISNKSCPVTIDPTLLIDGSCWDKMIDKSWSNKKYIVTYQVRRSKDNPNGIDKLASDYAKQMGLEIFELYGGSYGPVDFVSAIKYARCVFTSSFHATVFSIIFGTPFYSFTLNDGFDGRYVNLLNSLGLSDHLKQLEDDICECLPLDINKRDKALGKLRKFSIDFLENCFV